MVHLGGIRVSGGAGVAPQYLCDEIVVRRAGIIVPPALTEETPPARHVVEKRDGKNTISL